MYFYRTHPRHSSRSWARGFPKNRSRSMPACLPAPLHDHDHDPSSSSQKPHITIPTVTPWLSLLLQRCIGTSSAPGALIHIISFRGGFEAPEIYGTGQKEGTLGVSVTFKLWVSLDCDPASSTYGYSVSVYVHRFHDASCPSISLACCANPEQHSQPFPILPYVVGTKNVFMSK